MSNVLDLALDGSPVVWEKFGEPGNGMVRDAGQNVLEPDEWIDSDALTGSHKAAQQRGGRAAFITAKEHPVVAAYRYPADGALGSIVIDGEISVLTVAVSAVQFFRV